MTHTRWRHYDLAVTKRGVKLERHNQEIPVTEKIETIIIGGGQAGLATSYYLTQRGREHIVLEQAAQAGNVWRNQRWDSFTLVTPNWSFRLPGAEYEGTAPDGFLPRTEVVSRFEQYITRYQLPVRYDMGVTAVEPNVAEPGYQVKTEQTLFESSNVVIATGLYQQPKLPYISAELSGQITQLHSSQYRNPQALPPGAVLVVGSGQSGCQITEELYQSGRKVYLCTSGVGRAPRRYRGKDVYEWLHLSGFLDRPAEALPSPQAKFAPIPHLSGRDGGHTLNLHQFARDGVTLLGHLDGGRDRTIWFAPDLKENLAKADGFETQIVNLIDGYIARTGLTAPLESLPVLRDAYEAAEITELNLEAAAITCIIWATGYTFDFSLVKLPIFDSDGYPYQKQGVVTDYPGLFFVGLPWLAGQKSGLLLGVGQQAHNIAAAISLRI